MSDVVREEKLRIFCAALTGAMSQLGSHHVQSEKSAIYIAREAVRLSFDNDPKKPKPNLETHPSQKDT